MVFLGRVSSYLCRTQFGRSILESWHLISDSKSLLCQVPSVESYPLHVSPLPINVLGQLLIQSEFSSEFYLEISCPLPPVLLQGSAVWDSRRERLVIVPNGHTLEWGSLSFLPQMSPGLRTSCSRPWQVAACRSVGTILFLTQRPTQLLWGLWQRAHASSSVMPWEVCLSMP